MKMLTKLMVALIGSSIVVGCAGLDKAMTGSGALPTAEQRTSIQGTKYPTLSADQKAKFIKGEPWVGMTQDQLKDMWNNEPKKKQKKITARGSEEIQIYELRVGDWKSGIKSEYWRVNVVDGKVLELQQLDNNLGNFDNL